MGFHDPLFECVICERPALQWGGPGGRYQEVAPVCRGCEQRYGANPPQGGSFMDRRKSVQISALSEALLGTANIMKWNDRYGRS